MTRCVCCNKQLNDYESTRRHAITNEFLDTCNRCMKDIPNIPTKDRQDLLKEADYDDDTDTDGNDEDVKNVTSCYTLGLDKD